jgi:hypothetical protein
MSLAREWRLWLDGGRFGGVVYPFGMAQLASYVRNTVGAQNLFWVEGPDNSARASRPWWTVSGRTTSPPRPRP